MVLTIFASQNDSRDKTMFNQTQIHNFNAGPSALAPSVRTELSQAIHSIGGGPGILELSHRSQAFDRIIDDARHQISRLYEVPDSHEVLFFQSGASLQFAMVPYNLGTFGGYVTTGEWSRRALAEAHLIKIREQEAPVELYSEEANGFCAVPSQIKMTNYSTSPQLNYIHLTSNNTIYGTQYHKLPSLLGLNGRELPHDGFVIDASSDLFSKKIDWSKVSILYGGAQKNAGPSGVTLVIARKEISRSAARHPFCPKILAYRTHAEKGSLYHTPNTLGIFAIGAVARWLNQQGGLTFIAEKSLKRAQLIYQIIDDSDLYQGHADSASRSLMNLTFRTTIKEAESDLLEQAKLLNIYGLKGHRSVGGLRASLYNAVSDNSIKVLADLLSKTAKKFGA